MPASAVAATSTKVVRLIARLLQPTFRPPHCFSAAFFSGTTTLIEPSSRARWFASSTRRALCADRRANPSRSSGPALTGYCSLPSHLDHHFDRLPLVHRPIAFGHLVEADD